MSEGDPSHGWQTQYEERAQGYMPLAAASPQTKGTDALVTPPDDPWLV